MAAPRSAMRKNRVYGAKCPSIGFAVDDREAWPLSYSFGLIGGGGGSLSRLDHFGRSQAEGPAGYRESVPAAAVIGAAAKHPQPRLHNADRQFWICASRWFAGWRNSPLIVKPETVLRWHRRRWCAYWSWPPNRKRRRIGRRPIPQNLQTLIWQMAAENRLWGQK
jgi:hypothetical protein